PCGVPPAGGSWLRGAGEEAATPRSLAAPPAPSDAEIPSTRPTAPAELDRGAGTGGAPSRQLWFVYGAEWLTNRDAATALESARSAGARLVLVGDRLQR